LKHIKTMNNLTNQITVWHHDNNHDNNNHNNNHDNNNNNTCIKGGLD
jgi:hypothetical protein